MKTVLITGANGQLGNAMRLTLDGRDDIQATYTDVDTLDITSREALEALFSSQHFDYVVNCAAYTAVDRAESDEVLARKLNTDAVRLLCETKGDAHLVHISTDYVFDGTSSRPYVETDPVNPLTVYGRTKADAECFAVASGAVVLRTAWLYSPWGKNFVKTMIDLGRTRSELRVVADQVGTPTSALDLAKAIVTVIDAPKWLPGVYHFSDEGAISWYDFTVAIHRLAGISGCDVLPCNTADYPTPAHRPHYSVLDKSKFKTTFKTTIPHWESSLKTVINILLNQK